MTEPSMFSHISNVIERELNNLADQRGDCMRPLRTYRGVNTIWRMVCTVPVPNHARIELVLNLLEPLYQASSPTLSEIVLHPELWALYAGMEEPYWARDGSNLVFADNDDIDVVIAHWVKTTIAALLNTRP